MMLIFAALLGGLGAASRFLVDTWVNKRNRLTIPLGTIVVNITACLLMGCLLYTLPSPRARPKSRMPSSA